MQSPIAHQKVRLKVRYALYPLATLHLLALRSPEEDKFLGVNPCAFLRLRSSPSPSLASIKACPLLLLSLQCTRRPLLRLSLQTDPSSSKHSWTLHALSAYSASISSLTPLDARKLSLLVKLSICKLIATTTASYTALSANPTKLAPLARPSLPLPLVCASLTVDSTLYLLSCLPALLSPRLSRQRLLLLLSPLPLLLPPFHPFLPSSSQSWLSSSKVSNRFKTIPNALEL